MSDLVDSTGTSQRLGEKSASRLWAAHDRLARALLGTWRGLEIDKSDGFLMLFEESADAIAYALAYHRGLQTLPEPVKARVGLHSAELSLRNNHAADVARGAKRVEVDNWMAKAVTSRIMSLAHGGQTLSTATAAVAAEGRGLRRHAHGHWRLQGIDEPIELFELGDGDTCFSPPADAPKAWRVVKHRDAWLLAREISHSLPAERDIFVGRGDVLLDLSQQFRAGSRLISLHGIGGIGKTRLSLRFASQWMGDFPGGAWFCDLSSATSIDGLLYAVAQGLDIRLDPAETIMQISRVLASKERCLIVLDNFEQLVSMAESTLAHWMKFAPEACFLVTTRSLLGITGEHAFTVPSLSLDDAASLFRIRACDVVRQRPAEADEESTIARLVTLLDGLPLAIELAAARVRVMSVTNLLSRMGDRFGMLASPSRSVNRHATLRATLDWSWEQLAEKDRCALAQLSVFEGGFTLQDAEAVLDLPSRDRGAVVLDAIQSLVEKSMIRSLGDEHFDLLRSVQQYAQEHLANTGRFNGSGPEMLRSAHERHWRYFAGIDDTAAFVKSSTKVDNLAVACRRATASGDGGGAAGTLDRLWRFLRRSGPFKPVLELAQGVLSLPALDDVMRNRVERVLGAANELLGDFEAARVAMESALIHAQSACDREGEGWTLCALGEHLYKRGQPVASREHLNQALAISDDLASSQLRCAVLNAIGTLELRIGNVASAKVSYEQALSLARGLGDEARVGGLLGNLAILANDAGVQDTAMVLYQEALALVMRVRDRRWEGNTRCNLGLLYQDRGLTNEAQQQFEKALAIAREIGHVMLEATVLCNLGIMMDRQGDVVAAVLYFEKAVKVARHSGERRAEGQFLGYLGESQSRIGRFEKAFETLAEANVALRDVNDEVSVALLLCQSATAQYLAGQVFQAHATLARARQSIVIEKSAELRNAIARVESHLSTLAASSAVVGNHGVAGSAKDVS